MPDTLWTKMSHSVSALFGRPEGEARKEAPVEAAPPPFQSLLDLEATVRQTEARFSGNAPGVGEAAISARQVDPRDEEREAARFAAQMEQDILDLHRALGTGVDKAHFPEMAATYENVVKRYSTRRATGSMADQVVMAIMDRCYQETGTLAWEELTRAMRGHDVDLPVPLGLPPTLPADERAAACEKHWKELRLDFETALPGRLAPLLTGVVPVWRSLYPSRKSPLWKETCLRGVAAALKARWLARVVDIADRDRDALAREVSSIVDRELAQIRTRLAAGVESLDEAHRLSAQAVAISQGVASDHFWKRIAEDLAVATPA